MLFGSYDEELAWVVNRYVRPGDRALDVGANVGATVFLLAQRVGSTGRVDCFEPGPSFIARLRCNLALNPKLRELVHCHGVGLGDKPGTLNWAEDPHFPGNGYLTQKRGIEVPVVLLDDYFSGKTDRIDFIKIDVEGMEFEVLSGARRLLEAHRPTIFYETLMDFEAYRKEKVRQRAADLLLGLGYRLYRVIPNEGISEVRYPHFSANTLAIHPSRT